MSKKFTKWAISGGDIYLCVPPNQNVGGTCPPVPSIFAAPETLPIDDAKAGGVWSGN